MMVAAAAAAVVVVVAVAVAVARGGVFLCGGTIKVRHWRFPDLLTASIVVQENNSGVAIAIVLLCRNHLALGSRALCFFHF